MTEQRLKEGTPTPFQIWRDAQEASMNAFEREFWANLQTDDIPTSLSLFVLDKNSAPPAVVSVRTERGGEDNNAERFIFPYIRPYSPDILSEDNPYIGNLTSEMASKNGWNRDAIWEALIATHTILDFSKEVISVVEKPGISKGKQFAVHSAVSLVDGSKVLKVAKYYPPISDDLGKPIGGLVQYFSLYKEDGVEVYSVINEYNIEGEVNFTSLFPLALLFSLHARQDQVQQAELGQPEEFQSYTHPLNFLIL